MRGATRSRPNFFLCVPLYEAAALGRALVDEQNRLKVALPRIPPSKFHFTLCLLCLPEADIDKHVSRVCEVLDKVLCWEFEQAVAGTGCFGQRVVFAKAEGEHINLSLLQTTLTDALARGCPELLHTENRPWQAHCTLFKVTSLFVLCSLCNLSHFKAALYHLLNHNKKQFENQKSCLRWCSRCLVRQFSYCCFVNVFCFFFVFFFLSIW
jgi:2'-5' RNA ligase